MNTREVTDKLHDWQKQAQDTARELTHATDEYVHQNTWTSVGLAAVVGCVIGFLLARRD